MEKEKKVPNILESLNFLEARKVYRVDNFDGFYKFIKSYNQKVTKEATLEVFAKIYNIPVDKIKGGK